MRTSGGRSDALQASKFEVGVCIFMNRIEITGRLTADPEVSYDANSLCIAKFRIADNYYDKKTKEKKARYFNVVAFNKVAEVIGNTVSKGMKIHIGGTMDVRQYDKKDGTKGTWAEIILREFEYCEKKETAGQPA